jgi:hypothetical protein
MRTALTRGLLALAVAVMAGCGGSSDEADSAEVTEPSVRGTAQTEGTPDPTTTSPEPDSPSVSAEDDMEPADGSAVEENTVDVDALCRANDELVAFNEQKLAGFEPGSDVQQARAALSELELRFVEMSQVAPDNLREDLERYGSAFAAVMGLAIDWDFDFEAVPQEEIDAFVQEYPDLNLFAASPVEERIRSWFEDNCTTPFAF